jgi:hypothetical protein
METFKTVLICLAMVIGIVWIAVFFCALSDKLRGYRPPDVPESEEQESPTPSVPVPWWKWLLRAPLICLFIPVAVVLGIIFLPMMVFEYLWSWGARLRARISGRPVQHIES